MNQKKRLAIITYHGGLGGASKLVHDLVLKIHDEEIFEVSVIYAHKIDVFGEMLQQHGSSCILCTYEKWIRPKKCLAVI